VEDYGQTWLYPLLEPEKSTLSAETPAFPFRIWPNPASRILHVEWPESTDPRPVLMGIHSADGRLIRQFPFPGGTTSADLSLEGVPPGFYLLRVVTGDGIYATPFIRE
jgi:hypothetical protein